MVKVLALSLLFLAGSATGSTTEANPIRKVVTLMQDMQKEIQAEGEKEAALYEKFVCYCDSTSKSLSAGIETSKSKISDFSGKLEEDTAAKSSTDQELAQHKADREAAGKDLEQATAIREKEAAEYAEKTAESTANLNAMNGAIPALEKGMGAGAFVQMPEASRLRKIIDASPDAFDRQTVVAFLDQTGDFVPQSGQIVGILKQMAEEMDNGLKESKTEEDSAASGYAELKAAKTQEISAASSAIEKKTALAGELAVSVVQNQDSLDDSELELADNEKFLAELTKQCADKKTEWAARQSSRAEEIAAISEAIGVLNDDDALDVFKKALPSSLLQGGLPKVGFLQARQIKAGALTKAASLLAKTAQTYKSEQNLQLLSFTMSRMVAKGGSKGDFEVVKQMIVKMEGILTKEQAADDKHKGYCEAELAQNAKDQAANKVATEGIASTISDLKDQIAVIAEDISTLEGEIQALDLSVATATNQRKAEHAEYTEFVALNEAAMQLIEKARQRLYKFYNPVLYKAPPKKELTMEQKIYASAGRSEFNEAPAAPASLAQVSQHRHMSMHRQAPPPPPPTFGGGVEKKTEKSTGVLGLMDMILKDLDSDLTEAAHDEKTAQKDYEALMSDSATTRAQDAKSITDKEKSKAVLEGKVTASEAEKANSVEEGQQLSTVNFDLHGSCDFLLENYDMRKEARTNELESLKNSKSVLSGANFR